MPGFELSVVVELLAEDLESAAQAVGHERGHDEEPLPTVRSPDVRSSEQNARASVAQIFKVSEHSVEPEGNMTGDVLEDAEPRSEIVDDVADGRPEVPLVVFAGALAGEAEGLTGVSRNDEIHRSTPWSRIEGTCVTPDRSFIQPRFGSLHRFDQTPGGKEFPLHVANRANTSAACSMDSSVQPSNAGGDTEGT